jgi:hypothetical protein
MASIVRQPDPRPLITPTDSTQRAAADTHVLGARVLCVVRRFAWPSRAKARPWCPSHKVISSLAAGRGRSRDAGPRPDPGGRDDHPCIRAMRSCLSRSRRCSPSKSGSAGWVPCRLRRVDSRRLHAGPAAYTSWWQRHGLPLFTARRSGHRVLRRRGPWLDRTGARRCPNEFIR